MFRIKVNFQAILMTVHGSMTKFWSTGHCHFGGVPCLALFSFVLPVGNRYGEEPHGTTWMRRRLEFLPDTVKLPYRYWIAFV